MNDEGIFATIARDVLKGGLPYRDLFDIAPPLIYGWYAFGFLLFGQETWVPHLLLALVLSLTTLLVFIEGRLLFSPRAGYVAAFAFALSTGIVQMGSWAQPGYFVLLPLVAALVAFTLGAQRQRTGWYLAAGVFSGLAIITMQLVALHYLVLLAFSVGQARQKDRSWPGRYAPTAALLVGALVVLLALAMPYLASGALGDLYYGAIKYPLLYAGNLSWGTKAQIGAGQLARFLMVAGPWVVLSLVGAGALIGRRDGQRALVLAWAAASLLAIAITGRFNTHYFALLRPAMALLAGYAAQAFWPRQQALRVRFSFRAAFYSMFGVAVLFSAVLNGQVYSQPSATERHIVKVLWPTRVREAQSPSVAAYISGRTEPTDSIYNLGREGELYFHANRRPASRYFHEFPLRNGPGAVPKLLADLERNKPVYIVDTQWPQYLEDVTDWYPWEVLQFLKENYEYEAKIEFDPALVEIYKDALGDRYEERRLTYYGDLWRLKDEYRQAR